MMPERIQLSRAKGWRMPPNTSKVDRTSRWGNPFSVAYFGLERAVKLFENTMGGCWSPGLFDAAEPDWLVEQAYQAHCTFRARHGHEAQSRVRDELRGRNLACWCKVGTPCHADVLLRLANEAR